LSNAPDTEVSNGREALHRRGRVIEAMLLLCFARFLIIAVPMRFWRASLGRVIETEPAGDSTSQASAERMQVRAVAAAIRSGARYLPMRLACLPRAMAAQWMLSRRGCASRLVFAVGAGKTSRGHPLHAWVEASGEIVVGEDLDVDYRRNLTLQSPR
jgi:hypothetical protein